MKIVINQYDKEAVARLYSNGRYILVPIKWRAIKRELNAHPFNAKVVFSAIRRIAPLVDKEPSAYDVLLPVQPLWSSLAIWHTETVSKLTNVGHIHGNIIQYFRQSPLRLNNQLNLIKVCCFIADNLNYRHWCTFYNTKEIIANTKVNKESVLRSLNYLIELSLLEVVVCRSKCGNKIIGSYIRITEKFKEKFLFDTKWVGWTPLNNYNELDYLNHLNEIERVRWELLKLIRRNNYPDIIINQAFSLLIGYRGWE